MHRIHAFLIRREARAALAIWVIVPALFAFFALALAVDPTAHLDRVRLGVVELDAGVETPGGTVSIGRRVAEGLAQEVGVQVVPFATADDLRAAVLERDVAGGIVIPAGTTEAVLGGQPARLVVVRSDATDPFTAGFTASVVTRLSEAAAAAAPQPGADGGPTSSAPVIAVEPENVAPAADARFAVLPGSLVLPLWVATLAFAALLGRAAGRLRAEAGGLGSMAVELGVAVVGGAVVAAVVTLTVALVTGRWDADLAALFTILWLGLTATAWLLQGTMRLFGLFGGALLGVLALFVQQPVSGAAFPSSFAPDAVRWAEPVAPLRYLVEGVRNALVGGTTMDAMAVGLTLLGVAGAVLFAVGVALDRVRHRQRATIPTAASA